MYTLPDRNVSSTAVFTYVDWSGGYGPVLAEELRTVRYVHVREVVKRSGVAKLNQCETGLSLGLLDRRAEIGVCVCRGCVGSSMRGSQSHCSQRVLLSHGSGRLRIRSCPDAFCPDAFFD